jgi:U3 small nucleolar RNA-associated protein MPP10
MKTLFHKLDALANYTYTPSPATVEIKVISNIPAISREEVGQSVLSDANLLAPQEILEPSKGEIKSQAERTKTDMKRERRLKKKKQHLKRLSLEEKARAKGLAGTSIKLAENVVKKRGKSDNASPSNKELKTSKAFFAKLQDQVTTHIDKVAKRQQDTAKAKSLSAKRFKL